MKNLIAANPSMFPLRASLFYKRPNGQPGSTWDYLARDTTNETQEVIDAQIRYNSNCMTSLIYNMVDPKLHPVNPFVGNPTAAQVVAGQGMVDMAEIIRWHGLINWGKDPNLWFIPCLFCGDDSATTNNSAFCEYFLPAVIGWLNQYAKAYIISTEASKSMSINRMSEMIEFCKRYSGGRPVGVHNQGTNIPANADFLAYEFSWNPWNGNDHDVSEVISELKNAITKSPVYYVWPQEMNIYPECQRAREQTRAIRDLAASEPRIVGLPGPV